jgi:hypothetical protein
MGIGKPIFAIGIGIPITVVTIIAINISVAIIVVVNVVIVIVVLIVVVAIVVWRYHLDCMRQLHRRVLSITNQTVAFKSMPVSDGEPL